MTIFFICWALWLASALILTPIAMTKQYDYQPLDLVLTVILGVIVGPLVPLVWWVALSETVIFKRRQ